MFIWLVPELSKTKSAKVAVCILPNDQTPGTTTRSVVHGQPVAGGGYQTSCSLRVCARQGVLAVYTLFVICQSNRQNKLVLSKLLGRLLAFYWKKCYFDVEVASKPSTQSIVSASRCYYTIHDIDAPLRLFRIITVWHVADVCLLIRAKGHRMRKRSPRPRRGEDMRVYATRKHPSVCVDGTSEWRMP